MKETFVLSIFEMVCTCCFFIYLITGIEIWVDVVVVGFALGRRVPHQPLFIS